jgi:phosphatidylglycerophosphate synthase
MSGSFAALFAVHVYDMQTGKAYTIPALMIGVVTLTWVSAIDYLAVGWKQLRGRGDFARADAVRWIGSLAIPSLIFAVLVETSAPRWPLFLIISVELAAGGLDNLLSHHKVATKALAWGGRVLGVSAMLALALVIPERADLFVLIGAAGSTFGVGAEFWRGRNYFLDKRIRDKARRDAATPPPVATTNA